MTIYIRFFLISLLFVWPPFLKADWMNLTGAETAQNIAEIYVFEELVPDEWLNELASDSVDKRPSLKQRMQTFATKRASFASSQSRNIPFNV